ncbi:putative inorganic carbon transporter subunit DabA, partial [Salinibacterium sp.]|uniref:putative inorganic carbon transporter subunit DabA n=1 Tax=Salinibacterium sp. TaxID=1915057 RepID=UPI00286C9572
EEVGAVARMLALHPEWEHPLTWQRAYELHYRDELLSSINGVAEPIEPATVQLVMCIDPRSEGMRRQLERSASIETVGFAGFFGVPIRFVKYRARGAVNSLPALLAPRHTVTESPSDRAHASRRTRALRVRDAVASGLHAGDRVAAAPFALAETAGWFLGIWAALRTVAPGLAARLALRLDALTAQPVSTEVTVADAFTLEERAGMAETAMRMMGLTRCAPLVVLAGHGSTTTNNLYESSLECGACGGNPGAPNARAAAAIFNDPDVREVLGRRGIDIPHSTFFVAAEHNTVSDLVAVLDPHLVPQTHRAALADFEILQLEAARRLVRERAADLPGASARRGAAPVRRRAHDWAEVYPELGLAGNAAMIIGPRELTRGVDLKRRVFLHSYRTEFDPDGRALETILTAPVVVAQWINHQYYFSALGPDQLGAGTKTIHNAIGTLGVLSGQGGDLRRGLPWQSVGFGAELFHEPLRLAVVVQAPLDRIGAIVSRNQVLRDLFDNGWITLTARPGPGTPWRRYAQYGWAALPERTSTPEGAFP